MESAVKNLKLLAPFRESDLTQLELQVAKRADMLWRSAGNGGSDLSHWMQAESEVLGRLLELEPPEAAMAAAEG